MCSMPQLRSARNLNKGAAPKIRLTAGQAARKEQHLIIPLQSPQAHERATHGTQHSHVIVKVLSLLARRCLSDALVRFEGRMLALFEYLVDLCFKKG